MTITTTSILHRTVRLGAGFLIAGAVLVACGDPDEQVSSGPGAASAAAPEAAYVSPDQLDREAMLDLRDPSETSAVVDRSAKLDLSTALAREAIEERAANAAIDRSAKLDLGSALARQAAAKPEVSYVSPEQADRAAMLAVRNAMGSADAIERRATVEQSSAIGSADALERSALGERTSAHRSADALEHWALSDIGR